MSVCLLLACTSYRPDAQYILLYSIWKRGQNSDLRDKHEKRNVKKSICEGWIELATGQNETLETVRPLVVFPLVEY